MKHFVLLLITISTFISCNDEPEMIPISSADQVKYNVVFDATWSSETHPAEFPPNPHFSGLIGATHSEDVTLFKEGERASPGIKSMAETGSKSFLRTEIESLIRTGKADGLIDGSGVSPSPGRTSIEITVNKSHPYATITTMIAPSPDWYLAVSSARLFENGTWINELEVETSAYDSGTDSGTTFTSPNQVSEPIIPIHTISDGPLAVDGKVAIMGTFRFVRVSE